MNASELGPQAQREFTLHLQHLAGVKAAPVPLSLFWCVVAMGQPGVVKDRRGHGWYARRIPGGYRRCYPTWEQAVNYAFNPPPVMSALKSKVPV